MRTLPALMLLMSLALPPQAHAGDTISYNHLDLGVGIGFLADRDAYFALPVRVGGSVEITSHLFAYGSWELARYSALHFDDWLADHAGSSEDDYDNRDSEHSLNTGSELGLGLNWPLDPARDMFLAASWLHHHEKRTGGGLPQELIDADGANLQLGLQGIKGTAVAWSVVANVASLEREFRRARSYPDDAVSGSNRRALLGVTGGVRVQLGAVFAVGADLSGVRFAGTTDIRALLEIRLQFKDWD